MLFRSTKTIAEYINETGKYKGYNLMPFGQDPYLDIYDMDDKKSMAYKLIFKDDTRTLSDEEVMVVFNKIIEAVTTNIKAVLRDN